ncbi:MAG: hypothetical protein KC800_23505, partial [Candidatus Eremiobacteraeota bacterium]|nr:hypothetical protein [Candidatus Eremiobacteraeota bacterium]
MRWSKSLFFTLVLLLTVPGFAEPSLRDILRVGGVIIQMSRGSEYGSRQPSYRVPQRPRYPEVRYPASRAPRQVPRPPVSVGGRPAG